MDRVLRETVVETLTSSKAKRIEMVTVLAAVRRKAAASISDFEIQQRLLAVLKALKDENRLRLPKAGHCWDLQTGLPRYITAVRSKADAARQQRKNHIDALRHKTAWEPTRMVAFAHTLKTMSELERAVKVNAYLLQRRSEAIELPHRERALRIFGDEKALDGYTRKGLFGGRITLADLDCFYCPEPLPFRSLSMDKRKIAGKPLLVVENANTYWSCCQANAAVKGFAAVVYGQGFKITAGAAERASDGLVNIEAQLGSSGIAYFGDLDPAGIAIPAGINTSRRANDLRPLVAEYSLYHALLAKDRSVDQGKAGKQNHDPELARQWLGEELAGIYLQRAPDVRWPQEGLTVADIVVALNDHHKSKHP